MTDPKIIVALDFPDENSALQLVDKLDSKLCRLKVGKEMFTQLGPVFIEKLQSRDFQVFLDLKYHDIPNTVAKACSVAADLGVWMLNVHALGGRRMMEAAADGVANKTNKPHLIAVTILTSMSDEDLQEMGINYTASEMAIKLASMARASGLDGVVCSAQEASSLRKNVGDEFLLVTPGIRPEGSGNDDQRRIMSPSEAISAGSSYLVIGRPITQAEDPVGILSTINSEIC